MFEKEAEEYIKEHTFFDEEYGVQSLDVVSKTIFKDGADFGYNKVKEELEEERKLNAEIKARFVKCNTCTDEMKSKCLMFTENLCEGERCEELIDIVSLVNKSDLERKIEVLEKANEWHFVKDGEYPKEYKDILICFLTEDDMKDCVRGWYEYDSDNDKHIFKYLNVLGTQYLETVIAWKEIVLPELPKESEKKRIKHSKNAWKESVRNSTA